MGRIESLHESLKGEDNRRELQSKRRLRSDLVLQVWQGLILGLLHEARFVADSRLSRNLRSEALKMVKCPDLVLGLPRGF